MTDTTNATNQSELLAASSEHLTLLRQRIETLYRLRDLCLPALPITAGADAPYTIALPADPDAPLDQFAVQTEGSKPQEGTADRADILPEWLMTDDVPATQVAATQAAATQAAATQAAAIVAAGVHMPYWGLLWPSGQALAESILAQHETFRGQRVLELGCGLGLTAAAALTAGAHLWAADCFTEALLFTCYNTLRLAGQTPNVLLLDWRTPEGQAACRALGPFDRILAADVLYEQEDLTPLLTLVPQLLAPAGVFWLAEPGRRVARGLVATARAQDWQDQSTSYERVWPPDDEGDGTGEIVQVVVHRLIPPSSVS